MSDKEESMDDNSNVSSDSSSDDSDTEEDTIAIKIQGVKNKVKSNPNVFEHHVELLSVLRDAGELEELRVARNSMNKIFPLTPELWLQWIEDEKKLVSSEKERESLVKLFERALHEYNSAEVWLEYVQFSIGDMEKKGASYVREVFEKALISIGLHVTKASLVWQAYTEFECAVLAGLVPKPGSVSTPEQTEVYESQVKKIVSLFKRQLSIPLQGMESMFEEYQSFVEDTDPAVVEGYEKAKKKLNTLMPFEKGLERSGPGNTDAYKSYIKHELKQGDPARIQCLFERALIEHSAIPDFWLRYGKYLDQELRSRSAALKMYGRAVRNCPWCSDLWLLHLRAMERFMYSEHDVIKAEFEKVVNSNYLREAADYLKIWLGFCDYMRRRIDWSQQELTERIEALRSTFQLAIESMTQYYGKEGDPNCTLLQYQARIEAKFCKNMDKARDCWNVIMQQGFGNQAQMWIEYFNLERSFGDHKHCRKILQRALNSVTDWPDYVVDTFLNFEREEGTLEQYEQALEKCEAQIARLEERKAKAAEKETFQEDLKKTRQPSQQPQQRKGKVKTPESPQPRAYKRKEAGKAPIKTENNNAASPTKADRVSTVTPTPSDSPFKVPVAPPPGYKGASVEPPPGYQQKEEHVSADDEEPLSKKRKVVADEAPPTGSEESRITGAPQCKVFVSNLDFNIKESDLTPVFMKYGELKDIRLVKSFKGKSKGYGYVEFKDQSSASAALALDRSSLKGRPMYVSECHDDGTSKVQFKYATNLEKTKLFVKNLPSSVTKDSLEKVFAEHGKLKEVRLVTYRSGAFKGLAYVEYEDEESASKAVMKTDGFKMGDNEISVAISNPPVRKAQAKGEDTTFTPTLGGGKREADRGGRAKTMLAFQPRSFQQRNKITSLQAAKKPQTAEVTQPGGEGGGDAKSSKKTAGLSNSDFRNLLMKK